MTLRRVLPPLNAIRAFEAAARHGSFKDAAAELGVTHGAISRQVRLLEDWLGPPDLFHRLNRLVVLTPTGAALLDEAGPALDRISAATQRHQGRHGEAAPAILRVNALATFSLRWLLPRLALFRAQHPGIEVRLSTSNDLVDSVREACDVVIRGGPDAFYGFTARLFLSERRLPVCSPALVGRMPIAEVLDLGRHTLLHVASMPRLWSDWLKEAGAPRLEPVAALTLDHFYLSIQAALDGLGVAMGPSALVADDIAAGRLVAPFPAISLPARSYYAYVPDTHAADPVIAVFCAWLEEEGRVGLPAPAAAGHAIENHDH